jgi:predicted CXXCH cytochrome family protein
LALLVPSAAAPARRIRRASLGAALCVSALFAGCDRPAIPGDPSATPVLVSDRPPLVVQVSDAAGASVEAAWVVLTPGGRDALTDADGRASFADLGDGVFLATVTAPGFVTAEATVSVEGPEAALDVQLVEAAPRATQLAGAVLDPDGSPVAGVDVRVNGQVLATTDSAGVWGGTPGSGKSNTVELIPPADSNLVGVDLGFLTLDNGSGAWFEWSLAAEPPSDAQFIGSAACSGCHADTAARYAGSAHANASRTPVEAEADAALSELFDAFLDGDVVSLAPQVFGATMSLAVVGEDWLVTVNDAFGGSAGPFPVVEVYGGRSTGAALSVDAAGTEALVPAAWALAGGGLSNEQASAGWVAGFTAGWFDGTGHLSLVDGAPEAPASYALQCAGCHATGLALAEDGGQYTLVDAALALVGERQVGCEACHDRGSAHAEDSTPDRATSLLNPGRLHPRAKIEVCARCHENADPTAHPFADPPGWAVDSAGQPAGPLDGPALTSASPARWLDVPASKVGWDQAGDLRTSPHRAGPQGYLGACEDCHDPHGSDFAADLTVDPFDNTLCTTCHAADFPDEAAQATHSRHSRFEPGAWSPGACTSCHLPRTGISLRADAVSGAGELRSHALTFAEPDQSLAEFDAAGLSILPLGSMPVPACLDCHLQVDEELEDVGENCACAVGSPIRRETFEGMQTVFDLVWGAP